MRYRIIAYGKPSLPYAQDGIETYRKRIKHLAKVEERFLKDGKDILEASQKTYRIVLDERGKAQTTQTWANTIQALEGRAISEISFLIGPADGHLKTTRNQADAIWQLAPMTMNHELALLVLWEQIYRVHALLSGHPYHRA